MTKTELPRITEIVVAVMAALEEQPVPAVKPSKKASKKKDPLAAKKTAKPSAPKVDRAAKKAQNKVLWRQINGKVLKAENAKTEVLANGFLQEAMKMTPVNWTSVQNKIVAKQELLGIAV
jgi:hypothetical protein